MTFTRCPSAVISTAIASLILCGCESRQAEQRAMGSACPAEATQVVELLGQRMRSVSLLAPDSVVGRELAEAYSTLATDAVIEQWRDAPGTAPGREVSNPWPARIEIRGSATTAAGCRVEGHVVYVTTADTTTPVESRPVTVELASVGGWKVTSYTAAGDTSAPRGSPPARDLSPAPNAGGASSPSDAATADTAPASVVRRYYAAIDAGKYEEAYALWSRGGAASGKTLDEFKSGFTATRSVRATVTDSVRLEGAAGSQFATVPVTVDATLKTGATQHFTGEYTMRRSMVDGATAAQRTWHIYAARLSGG
jgi:hypothetical protein